MLDGDADITGIGASEWTRYHSEVFGLFELHFDVDCTKAGHCDDTFQAGSLLRAQVVAGHESNSPVGSDASKDVVPKAKHRGHKAETKDFGPKAMDSICQGQWLKRKAKLTMIIK